MSRDIISAKEHIQRCGFVSGQLDGFFKFDINLMKIAVERFKILLQSLIKCSQFGGIVYKIIPAELSKFGFITITFDPQCRHLFHSSFHSEFGRLTKRVNQCRTDFFYSFCADKILLFHGFISFAARLASCNCHKHEQTADNQ